MIDTKESTFFFGYVLTKQCKTSTYKPYFTPILTSVLKHRPLQGETKAKCKQYGTFQKYSGKNEKRQHRKLIFLRRGVKKIVNRVQRQTIAMV